MIARNLKETDPFNVLLADDDSDDCYFFKEALKEFPQPTNLVVVNDGEQLMQLLNEVNELPGVLFLDLNMPRMNGVQFLTQIKKNRKLSVVPTIIYTTSGRPEDREETQRLGAAHFLTKGASFKNICEAISFIVDNKWKMQDSSLRSN